MKLNIIKLYGDSILPSYGSAGAAGMDLHARIASPVFIQPGARFACPTGIAIELPEGFGAQICPRSGLALKNGITILNSPGVIDPDFRGEIGAILFNDGDQAFEVKPGDRIAQMVIAPFIRVELMEVWSLGNTERGENGFGSTGV